ncbi:hypothetical protein [Cryobacterium sp. PAMC25264]|uniref:hypothetical protein n=1 Tax=Cryobacterium sp. PAMC25264 TaxID=2861288 RepID=UPI001C633D42|nr:hypothetical protein [Cryobacterium sp. PAMC25264]QYF74880.1 hypothetical protein KY500_07025 [Cryobacterium sp. PAMC25264]
MAGVLGPQRIPIVTLSGDESKDIAQVDAVIRRWFEIREKHADVIEAELREPIDAAVRNSIDALNFLEDTELRDTAHALVHQAALLRFGFLGCKLRMENGGVKSDCPVRIAHQRWGLSPEIVTEWSCSICRQRFDSCPHIPGEEYQLVVDRSSGTCSACHEDECEHQHGERVSWPAHQVAVSIEALAIAMVARPRDPRARVASLPVGVPSGSEILKQIEAGDGICSECILPCTGFIQPDGLL